MAVVRSLTIDECLAYMTGDLQSENLFYRPEISEEWQSLREDIRLQRWDTILTTLSAFEETVRKWYGYKPQDAASRFPNYFNARHEILQRVTQHQTQRQTEIGTNSTASRSGIYHSTQFSIQQCVKNMESDLHRNYRLANAEVGTRWQALRQDLENQQWNTVQMKLQTFEETFNRIYGSNYENKLFNYRMYWSARNDILQRIKEQQNVQKHTADSSNSDMNISRTLQTQGSTQIRHIDVEQCLHNMEIDLKGSKNYLCTGPISGAWQTFQDSFRNQQWSALPVLLRKFEKSFLDTHGYQCETNHHLFPRYIAARDQIQQKIEEMALQQEESAPTTTISIAPQNSSLNIPFCLQTMENELRKRYPWSYLQETTLQTKWNAFRMALEEQRWTFITQTLEDFENTFFRIYRLQLKDSTTFPDYTEQRKVITKAKEDAISKTKDLWGMKSFDDDRSSQTKEETIPTSDFAVIERTTTPSKNTMDAEYLQMCIKWLKASIEQSDESAVQHPIPVQSGISRETFENSKRMEDIYKYFKRIKQQNAALCQDKQSLEDEITKYKHKVQVCDKMKEKVERLQTETILLQQKLNTAESDKQYWMNRVSKEAGTKLTTNNPGITDLSDPNRPQKLAEKFGELYDNTWTDALERMIEKTCSSEVDNIKRLALFLQSCYAYCHKLSIKHIKDLQSVLLTLAVNGESNGAAEIPKSLLDARKETAYSALTAVRQKTMEAAKRVFQREVKLIPDFIESCVDICWGMVVHEPKLCFLWLEEGKDKIVNPDQFSLYTRSGTGVEFLVWPAMLLHENGPVLRKGTYQPFEDKKYR